MRKLSLLLLALLVVTASVFAQVDLAKVKDGFYFAQDDKYSSSGWKEQVIVEVKGGKIVDVTWNGVSNLAGAKDKANYAAAGKYGMAKASKIKAEWDVQAKAAAAYLVKTQDVNFAKFDKAGIHPRRQRRLQGRLVLCRAEGLRQEFRLERHRPRDGRQW